MVFGDPDGADLFGGEPTWPAVRPVGVALDPLCLDNDSGFEERPELFDLEEFVTGVR